MPENKQSPVSEKYDKLKVTYSKLDELNNAYISIPLKINSVLTAAENITKLKPHLDTILNVKSKLIEQYGGKGEKTISSTHKNWDKFVRDFNKSLENETEVEGIKKIKKSELDLSREVGVNIQGFIATLINCGLLED